MSGSSEPSGEASGSFRLDQPVTFDSLVRLRSAGESAISAAADAVLVDLAGLEHSNSAAVALLMAWWREAERQGKRITFRDPPAALRDIVELSGMTEVLPFAPAHEEAVR